MHVPDLPLKTPQTAIDRMSTVITASPEIRNLAELLGRLGNVRLVWLVDPRKKSVTVYSSLTRSKVIPLSGTLDGGKVLPGF